MNKKPNKYWTLNKCKEDALKYNTPSEWEKNNTTAYNKARKNKWLMFCTAHMQYIRKHNNYWTYKTCLNDAKNYSTKKEWRIKSGGAYLSSVKNKWLDECCKHMKLVGSEFKRLIYAFEFSDKSVYVGLTYNSKNRILRHHNDERSQVKKYINLTGLIPIFIELTDFLDVNVAVKKEGEFVDKYRNNNWKILNKRKTGGLGSTTLRHKIYFK